MNGDFDDSDSRGGWSDAGADGEAPPATLAPGVPATPERYAVGARLGEGGMGVVHAARDGVLGRDVALKALRDDREASALARARLAREAALTSRLDHPGIMTVHDAGTLPDGRAFYTMRLVRGRSLAEAIAAAADAGARRRLVRVVLSAAEAVAAAHDMGVVHRDLKPANILLGPHGETQVADWGLAVPTPAAADRWAALPPLGATGAVGTRGFSAPEQQAGVPADPRHDVYSLGRTLAAVLGEAGPAELQAIVQRATAPDPAHRYADAAGLAEDLLAWFEGRRVEAHRYTPGELLRRTLRAWRAPLLAGLVGLLGVAAAVLAGWWQTTRSLDRALAAEAIAGDALAALRVEEATRATLAGARAEAEDLALRVLAHGDDPVARGVLAAFGRAGRPRLRAEQPTPACASRALSPDGAVLACATPEAVSASFGGAERWRVADGAEGVAWTPDGVLAWSADGALRLLDPDTGAERGRWPRPIDDWTTQTGPRAIWVAGGPLHLQAPPPSGCEGRLLVADVSADGRVAALCESGRLLVAGPGGTPLAASATEARGDHVGASLRWYDDETVVVGTLRGRLLLVRAETGETLRATDTALGAISTVVADAGRRLVAASGTRGGVALWRADAGALVAEVPAGWPRTIALSPEGLVVAAGDRRQEWALPDGAPTVVSADAGLSRVSLATDGGRLVATGGDGLVLTLDLGTGRVERRRFGERVTKAALLDGGGLIVTGMDAPALARATEQGWRPLPGARPLRRLGRLAGGALLGLDMDDGLHRWDHDDAPPTRHLRGRRLVDLAVRGDRAVVLDTEGGLTHLRADGTLAARESVPEARAVALGERCLAVATLEAVRVRCGAGETWLPGAGSRLLDVALSPDEDVLVAGTLEGPIRAWALPGGELLGVLPGHTERVVSVAFLPDGDLASASWDHTLRLWDMGALRRSLPDSAGTSAPPAR